jgi:putative DNA primase/helicase
MKYELSDLGDACRVADRYGEDLLRTVDTKKWYRWRKTCWERIDKVEVENLVAETTEDLIANPGTSDPDLRAAIRKHAIKSQSTNKIEAISKRLCGVAVDRGDRIDVPLDRGRRIGIPIYSEVLDGDLDLIGTPIGPIDLRTGRLLQPQRGFLITKSTSVSSDSSVPTPLWDSLMRFVCDVPGGGPELEKWIQTTFGYFLTGHNTEQVFFILWGRGCNAKSTVIQAVGDILGDYTKAISQETLMASSYHKGGEARSDLAKLQGARYIPAVESSQQGKLDEVTVKLLTGGDYIVARALYQEEKQFRNQGKLILATNNKPAVREFTHAMWRRIRLIPFTNQVEDPDPLYGERLKDEYAGILAWMVEGARLWYENGLGIHPIVGLATADYADEMDTLAPFFDECCEIDPRQDWYEPIQHLHARYTAWCESIGTEPISTNAFSRYVTQKFGLESKHVRGQGRVRRGIRIIGSDAQGNTTVEVLQGEMC